ncbi:MAG: amidohydrolase family protein [Synergistaceae bacterium]|nr:amidohydrolase family protein [Synergistaceae bacterium]
MTTINPARHMKIDDRAVSLTVGYPADIAVFRKEEFMTQFGDRTFNDSSVQLRYGKYVYRCVMTVKNGEVVYRDVMF